MCGYILWSDTFCEDTFCEDTFCVDTFCEDTFCVDTFCGRIHYVRLHFVSAPFFGHDTASTHLWLLWRLARRPQIPLAKTVNMMSTIG